MHARNLLLALALLTAGYALGSTRMPARADDSSRMVEMLRDLGRSSASQAESLKTIARASEKCAK